jgi:EAL domain-containing protein (putative c-di-GMP-specific phosphodiesterase class I)
MLMEPPSVPERPQGRGPSHQGPVPPGAGVPARIRRQEAWLAEQLPAQSESEPPAIMGTRVEEVLKDRMLVTALQPIRQLSTGMVVGAEALTRFVSHTGEPVGAWFAAAAKARLDGELEFAALEAALAAAENLPAPLYVALKLSPATCLHPLLPALLDAAAPALGRVVLELTQPLAPDQPAALVAALAPLRRRGLRLAVGHLGAYCNSIRHIRQLGPDIVKLDRNLVAGIDGDASRHHLGEALTTFAEQLGAVLIAEGIETPAELAAISGLGITAGHGYFLGRPSLRPRDWAAWNDSAFILPR